MPETPQTSALPGTSPLGIPLDAAWKKSFAAIPKTVLGTLQPGTFFCLHDCTICEVIDSVKGGKVNIMFKASHEEVAHWGNLPGCAMVLTLEREEILPMFREILNKGYSDHLQKQMDRHHEMAQKCRAFKLGSRVFFMHPKNGKVIGTVIKVNSKTVQLVTDEQVRWNCGPSSLSVVQ